MSEKEKAPPSRTMKLLDIGDNSERHVLSVTRWRADFELAAIEKHGLKASEAFAAKKYQQILPKEFEYKFKKLEDETEADFLFRRDCKFKEFLTEHSKDKESALAYAEFRSKVTAAVNQRCSPRLIEKALNSSAVEYAQLVKNMDFLAIMDVVTTLSTNGVLSDPLVMQVRAAKALWGVNQGSTENNNDFAHRIQIAVDHCESVGATKVSGTPQS